MNTRSLKIESRGADFNPAKRTPQLRLKGKWLERLGFPPGQRVTVTPVSTGVLTLTINMIT